MKRLFGSQGWLRRFARSEKGATAIEYALIAGLIVVAIVGAINFYTIRVQGMYNNISGNL